MALSSSIGDSSSPKSSSALVLIPEDKEGIDTSEDEYEKYGEIFDANADQFLIN